MGVGVCVLLLWVGVVRGMRGFDNTGAAGSSIWYQGPWSVTEATASLSGSIHSSAQNQ